MTALKPNQMDDRVWWLPPWFNSEWKEGYNFNWVLFDPFNICWYGNVPNLQLSRILSARVENPTVGKTGNRKVEKSIGWLTFFPNCILKFRFNFCMWRIVPSHQFHTVSKQQFLTDKMCDSQIISMSMTSLLFRILKIQVIWSPWN